MSQISEEKRMLLEMLSKGYPNYKLDELGLDRVISMSVQDLEDILLGEM